MDVLHAFRGLGCSVGIFTRFTHLSDTYSWSHLGVKYHRAHEYMGCMYDLRNHGLLISWPDAMHSSNVHQQFQDFSLQVHCNHYCDL